MPEYLAPGVYVEETSFRAKSIEGVSTTTTGFIGPTRYGPTDLEPDIITSLGEFERVFGDRQQLKFTQADGILVQMHNYLWHAVRAFFEEGGKRLYVQRVFNPLDQKTLADSCAHAWLSPGPVGSSQLNQSQYIRLRARYPGEAGKMRVRLTLRLSQNVLSSEPIPGQLSQERTTVKSLLDGDVVWISDLVGSPPSLVEPSAEAGDYYLANQTTDPNTNELTWAFTRAFDASPISSPPSSYQLSDLRPDPHPNQSDKVKVVSLTVTVMPTGQSDLPPLVYEGLPLDPNHKRAGEPDSVFDRLSEKPSSLADRRRIPVIIERVGGDATNATKLSDGIEVLKAFFNYKPDLAQALNNPAATDAERSIDLLLKDGDDGQRPMATEYEGTAHETDPFKTGLKAFEDIEDISIIAAPGATFDYENGYRKDAATIMNLLISHAERMRYRIAVLDSGEGQTIAQVRAMRARVDSKHAALYYPWIRILDPVTRREISVPPSGAVAGIYARNDINRAVYKAPANEVVNTAIGFELLLNKAQQEVLNPEGINCFRFFEGRGFRLWGARTISSDPEWKYVNLRRYFAYLERSIDRGTQWAVFEPNGDALWANVRRTIEDFLFNEWQMGALLGEKPEKAYFVKCDRTTMTQNDLDNGRLVCLIGIAPLRPAEFVIFRIGQWTGDRKV